MSKLKTDNYNPSLIESKWQAVWEKEKIYSPNLDTARKPFYNLMMFPYPSAEGMHVGNMYAFTGADVYGRFQRMQGKDVFEPIGLDGFGIHSENYAIKQGTHPAKQAKISEKKFYEQLRSTGNSFDWDKTVETYKPEYYKWTQWLFIQLFKAGLAYRKKAPVNFCTSCKTVLADEQVVAKSEKRKAKSENFRVDQRLDPRESAKDSTENVAINVCERCETEIEKRELEQWFFKITKYADRLLNGLSRIDWSEKVKIAQKLWIGKSEGVNLTFKVKDLDIHFEMFDSIPQTFMAQTFTVIAPEHPMVYELVKGTKNEKQVLEFVEKIKKKKAVNKFDLEKKPEGIFTGRYLEYTPTGKLIPIWVASYAIYGYGTGIVNCSVHDERDLGFAKKYGIPLHPVMFPQDPVGAKKVKNLEYCYHHVEDGILQEPAEFKGRKWGEVRLDIIKFIEEKGYGKRSTQYHLRDWLISRQRYWGPPIPLVFCENCARRINDEGLMIKNVFNKGELENPGWIAVGEKDLPVELPFIKDYKPLGTGAAPLANHQEFYKTTCPKCTGPAKRETDVSDTFLDSAWYFLRYVSTDIDTTAFDLERVKKWLPVDMYIGGAEHSVLHLLYSRFITMVLHDLGFLSFEEPFTKFRAHGLIIRDGAKMSKSKGNVVIPDEYIKKFGADSLRAYLMFMGPFSQGGDFRDSGIEGMHRFLRRVWTLLGKSQISPVPSGGNLKSQISNENLQMMHKTIKKVTEDIKGLNYNTAIAALMEWYNEMSKSKNKISKIEIETFAKLLAPFAPHFSEELFSLINGKSSWQSIHLSAWPVYDEKFLVRDELVIVVQVNGKLRGSIKVKNEKLKTQNYIEELAKKDPNVAKYLKDKEIRKVIYVEGKVINFVTSV